MRRTITGEPDPQRPISEERDTVRLTFLGDWEEGTGRPVEEHARRHPRHAGVVLTVSRVWPLEHALLCIVKDGLQVWFPRSAVTAP